MKIQLHITLILCGMFAITGQGIAQEEQENAEISLETYSDAFQEHFFNALKEKAIENHDKAINLLMECKKLDPGNAVIDYELGKNHFALKQYPQAENYFKNAIAKTPENSWYADALFNLYKTQKNIAEAIKLGEQLAQKHYKYKESLIQLYARYQHYKEAIQLLDELDKALGVSTQRKKQRIRYQMLLNVKNNREKVTVKEEEKQNNNPLDVIQVRIENYRKSADYSGLLTFINEVLETYPSQSKFYYTKGKTLNHLEKHTEAATVLETALDFLVDDAILENNIYKELVLAYKALGDTKKAGAYSKKLKNKA